MSINTEVREIARDEAIEVLSTRQGQDALRDFLRENLRIQVTNHYTDDGGVESITEAWLELKNDSGWHRL